MPRPKLIDRFLEELISGKRCACQDIVQEFLQRNGDAKKLYFDLLWPAMERVDLLFREDRINVASEHMATRINRSLADQIQRELPRKEPNGNRVVIGCCPGESIELGAQMCADLFEAKGWEVYFLGGGVPNDEILELVGQLGPSLLLIYGMTPQGVPELCALIDLIREVGVNPTMNIMVSGGVFERAEDLWREINADLYAATAKESLEIADHARPRTPDVRRTGTHKKRRRRRRPPLLEQLERQKS